eukprot:g82553.t1
MSQAPEKGKCKGSKMLSNGQLPKKIRSGSASKSAPPVPALESSTSFPSSLAPAQHVTATASKDDSRLVSHTSTTQKRYQETIDGKRCPVCLDKTSHVDESSKIKCGYHWWDCGKPGHCTRVYHRACVERNPALGPITGNTQVPGGRKNKVKLEWHCPSCKRCAHCEDVLPTLANQALLVEPLGRMVHRWDMCKMLATKGSVRFASAYRNQRHNTDDVSTSSSS